MNLDQEILLPDHLWKNPQIEVLGGFRSPGSLNMAPARYLATLTETLNRFNKDFSRLLSERSLRPITNLDWIKVQAGMRWM